jgi:hypothetical protein
MRSRIGRGETGQLDFIDIGFAVREGGNKYAGLSLGRSMRWGGGISVSRLWIFFGKGIGGRESRRFGGFVGWRPLLFGTRTLGLVRVSTYFLGICMMDGDTGFSFISLVLCDMRCRSSISWMSFGIVGSGF